MYMYPVFREETSVIFKFESDSAITAITELALFRGAQHLSDHLRARCMNSNLKSLFERGLRVMLLWQPGETSGRERRGVLVTQQNRLPGAQAASDGGKDSTAAEETSGMARPAASPEWSTTNPTSPS